MNSVVAFSVSVEFFLTNQEYELIATSSGTSYPCRLVVRALTEPRYRLTLIRYPSD